MSNKRKGLGRGLEALLDAKHSLDSLNQSQPASTEEGVPVAVEGELIQQIPIERIQRGQFQPRSYFDEDELNAMAQTIKSIGLMQPIMLRKIAKPSADIDYEIIAGERRWRACQIAGLDTVSATITNMEDDQVAAMALIENVQREDLNPIEEARAYDRLKQDFDLNQDEIAKVVGKSRPAVANLMRLLTLDESVRLMLENGDLDMGHARALLSLEGHRQRELAKQVVSKGLSVRQTENLVKQSQQPKSKTSSNTPSADTLRLQNRLEDILGSPVSIAHQQSGKGKIVINYHSLDELDGIIKHIK